MNLHCLTHVAFEGPGAIAAWARAAGHRLATTRLYEGVKLPEVEAIDGLIVMGGPMNVYETDRHPWLDAEKRFIGQALNRGKILFGVCLGAQLIADVLGARVFPNAHREIGWFPVHRAVSPSPAPLGELIPDGLNVLHWHGDTFDLPSGAVHLAASDACRHQAFAVGRRVLALQFHLEMEPENVRSIVARCSNELTAGPYTQTAEQILGNELHFDRNRQVLFNLLDRLTGAT